MTPALAQREAALAGVALLAAVVALVLHAPHDSGAAASKLPQPVLAPGGGWYSALAGERRPVFGKRTKCGQLLQPATNGVSDPVLPCGAKIFIWYGKIQVLTQVIDKGPYVPGRRFDLTEALADRLGLHGVKPVRWTFAR